MVADYLRDAAQARNADGEPVYAAATLRRWAGRDRRSPPHVPTPLPHSQRRGAPSALGDHEGRAPRRPGRSRPAAPLLTADIAAMIAAARKDTTGWASEVLERRDSALVLMGYAGALGRG